MKSNVIKVVNHISKECNINPDHTLSYLNSRSVTTDVLESISYDMSIAKSLANDPNLLEQYILLRLSIMVASVYKSDKDVLADHFQTFNKLIRSVKYYMKDTDFTSESRSIIALAGKYFRKCRMHTEIAFSDCWNLEGFMKQLDDDKRRRIKK